MKVVIDGKVCEAESGEYILQVARRNGIHIPTLCHSDALPGQANCRLCIVEVIENKKSKVVVSCVYPIRKEIEVITNSKKIIEMRKTIISLLLARAPEDEGLKVLKEEYGAELIDRFKVDEGEKCILCGLCVQACDEMGSSAIASVNRGITKKISTPYEEASEACIGCGACASVCPTGAIKMEEKNGQRTIWHKTFELLKCKRCGHHFATAEQIKYVEEKLGYPVDHELCEKCKKAVTVEKLKDIFESAPVR